uniref:Uncharacterized protein n=1 Tax=Anguilla anguilla TaxID=7936 RepID=A0A0E9R7Z2_ANGAN
MWFSVLFLRHSLGSPKVPLTRANILTGVCKAVNCFTLLDYTGFLLFIIS